MPRAGRGVRSARVARRLILPAAVLVAGGCFATREDMATLQTDLQTVRAQEARADSARQRQLAQVTATLGAVTDSLGQLSGRLVQWQGDVRSDLYAVQQELIQVQALTGQSQRRLQELRAGLDARSTNAPTGSPGLPGTTPADTTGGGGGGATSNVIGSTPPGAGVSPAPGSPGPNELFQLALDQLRRGSTGAARSGFEDLLRQYPNADIAADAQFYLAETYANEGNMAAADSGYQAVVAKYPSSPRASTALYKHGVVMQAMGNLDAARAAFENVVRTYPRSDESVLAKDRLRALKPS